MVDFRNVQAVTSAASDMTAGRRAAFLGKINTQRARAGLTKIIYRPSNRTSIEKNFKNQNFRKNKDGEIERYTPQQDPRIALAQASTKKFQRKEQLAEETFARYNEKIRQQNLQNETQTATARIVREQRPTTPNPQNTIFAKPNVFQGTQTQNQVIQNAKTRQNLRRDLQDPYSQRVIKESIENPQTGVKSKLNFPVTPKRALAYNYQALSQKSEFFFKNTDERLTQFVKENIKKENFGRNNLSKGEKQSSLPALEGYRLAAKTIKNEAVPLVRQKAKEAKTLYQTNPSKFIGVAAAELIEIGATSGAGAGLSKLGGASKSTSLIKGRGLVKDVSVKKVSNTKIKSNDPIQDLGTLKTQDPVIITRYTEVGKGKFDIPTTVVEKADDIKIIRKQKNVREIIVQNKKDDFATLTTEQFKQSTFRKKKFVEKNTIQIPKVAPENVKIDFIGESRPITTTTRKQISDTKILQESSNTKSTFLNIETSKQKLTGSINSNQIVTSLTESSPYVTVFRGSREATVFKSNSGLNDFQKSGAFYNPEFIVQKNKISLGDKGTKTFPEDIVSMNKPPSPAVFDLSEEGLKSSVFIEQSFAIKPKTQTKTLVTKTSDSNFNTIIEPSFGSKLKSYSEFFNLVRLGKKAQFSESAFKSKTSSKVDDFGFTERKLGDFKSSFSDDVNFKLFLKGKPASKLRPSLGFSSSIFSDSKESIINQNKNKNSFAFDSSFINRFESGVKSSSQSKFDLSFKQNLVSKQLTSQSFSSSDAPFTYNPRIDFNKAGGVKTPSNIVAAPFDINLPKRKRKDNQESQFSSFRDTRKFTPTFTAFAFNIEGKKRRGTLTGLEFRGV